MTEPTTEAGQRLVALMAYNTSFRDYRAAVVAIEQEAAGAAAPDAPSLDVLDAAREVVRFYGTNRSWSLAYRQLLGNRIDDLGAALETQGGAEMTKPTTEAGKQLIEDLVSYVLVPGRPGLSERIIAIEQEAAGAKRASGAPGPAGEGPGGGGGADRPILASLRPDDASGLAARRPR